MQAPHMAFEHAVALTGGIATGKSSAASIFESMGWAIIDADTIAHTVLDAQHVQVVNLFGRALVHDGHVDRPALGRIVFGDAEKRRQLEALVHPRIYEAIRARAVREDAHQKPYLIDIPLFYERAAYPIERVVVVYAPRSLQKTRLMQREGLSEAEALQRLDAQMDIETKRRRATWVIDNRGDRTQLRKECIRIATAIAKD